VRFGLFEVGSVVLVRAVTPVHVGVGRAGGVVDLPVQRDVYGFPACGSSGVKGAVRASLGDDRRVEAVFGPWVEGGGGDEGYYAGAFNVLDLRLLFFPVRSLRGVYAFVTCPLLLRVFMDYLEAAGSLDADVSGLMDCVKELLGADVGEGDVLVESDVFTVNGKVVLNEEFVLTPRRNDGGLSEFRKVLMLGDAYSGRLMVVCDDVALGLVERSVQRVPRLKLEPGAKKVARGALWVEENVPADTVFHTVFMYSRPRGKGADGLSDAVSVREFVEGHFESRGYYLVIGGNETVGRGLVKLTFIGGVKVGGGRVAKSS